MQEIENNNTTFQCFKYEYCIQIIIQRCFHRKRRSPKGNYVIKKCVLFFFAAGFYNTVRGTNNIPQIKKTEVTIMALSNLFGWAQKNGEAAASACGSACGAGDK